MKNSPLCINPRLLKHVLVSGNNALDSIWNEDEDSTLSDITPDKTMLDNICIHSSTNQHPFSPSQVVELRIHDLLQRIKAPLFAYDELMNLLADIQSSGHTFDRYFLSRK